MSIIAIEVERPRTDETEDDANDTACTEDEALPWILWANHEMGVRAETDNDDGREAQAR
jgi:hypothetical protein